MRILSKGAAGPVDDGEFIELVTVPLHESQLVIAELRKNGIDATALDSFNVVTSIASDGRILVRRRDLVAAQSIVVDRFSR